MWQSVDLHSVHVLESLAPSIHTGSEWMTDSPKSQFSWNVFFSSYHPSTKYGPLLVGICNLSISSRIPGTCSILAMDSGMNMHSRPYFCESHPGAFDQQNLDACVLGYTCAKNAVGYRSKNQTRLLLHSDNTSLQSLQFQPLLPWKWFSEWPQSKSTAARPPQKPHAPCTELASNGSSILGFRATSALPVTLLRLPRTKVGHQE